MLPYNGILDLGFCDWDFSLCMCTLETRAGLETRGFGILLPLLHERFRTLDFGTGDLWREAADFGLGLRDLRLRFW